VWQEFFDVERSVFAFLRWRLRKQAAVSNEAKRQPSLAAAEPLEVGLGEQSVEP
jgi:hypothetical protein